MAARIKESYCRINTIGKGRFITELLPITGGKGLTPGAGFEDLNQEFLIKHKNDIDGFLISNGYYDAIPYSADDPDYVFTPGDDDSDDVVPDLSLFTNHLQDLSDANQNDYGEQSAHISKILYRDLYDAEDVAKVNTAKAAYLCSTLSGIFAIEYIDIGRAGGIMIYGMLTDLRVMNMVAELGFPSSSYPKSFIKYLQEYINDELYQEDGFSFGEAVLKAFDNNVEPIEWFE